MIGATAGAHRLWSHRAYNLATKIDSDLSNGVATIESITSIQRLVPILMMHLEGSFSLT